MQTWFAIAIEPAPLVRALPEPAADLRRATSILAPGAEQVLIIETAGWFPGKDIKHLGSDRHTPYVYGEITYPDAFDGSRRTRFRLACRGRDVFDRLRLVPDTEGNEAD